MEGNYPVIRVSAQGQTFLDRGQMWLYRNNVIEMDDSLENGTPVDLIGEDGRYHGTGFLSKQSHITVRILTKNRGEELDREFFRKRIRFAWEYRKTAQRDNLDNCRLIFSEADMLGGLIADRYDDVIVTQVSSYGMEKNKDLIYEVLLEVLREDGQKVSGIYERNDIAIRKKEGLEMYKGPWNNTNLSTDLQISENGLKLDVDIENGQKTGYFLDQKTNRMLIRKLAYGKKVLDCFTHTGGFALNAAYGSAKDVTAVDVSAGALEQARANAVLNGLEGRMHFVQADVFDYLGTIRPGEFDLIILDPPAFTKSRRTVGHAYNGYKKINSQAMNVLRSGGYLATCSCSRYMETSLFEKMLREAAAETGVILRQVSVTQQNSDHPILWQMDETSYLKFYIFQII